MEGSQVSWGSEDHIKRSHGPERPKATNAGLISRSQSSQRSWVRDQAVSQVMNQGTGGHRKSQAIGQVARE